MIYIYNDKNFQYTVFLETTLFVIVYQFGAKPQGEPEITV